MIPRIVPPLTGLTVLVTRPAAQCAVLCAEIERQGGSAIAFPAVEIEPVAVQAAVSSADYDLVVFVSVNAVEHGARQVARSERTQHLTIHADVQLRSRGRIQRRSPVLSRNDDHAFT